MVFAKVQALMGGRIRQMVTGAAPVNPDVLNFARCVLGARVSSARVISYGSHSLATSASERQIHHVRHLSLTVLRVVVRRAFVCSIDVDDVPIFVPVL